MTVHELGNGTKPELFSALDLVKNRLMVNLSTEKVRLVHFSPLCYFFSC